MYPAQHYNAVTPYIVFTVSVLLFTVGFSFEVVKIIHEKLLDQIGASNKVPLVLVGNKTDLHMQR